MVDTSETIWHNNPLFETLSSEQSAVLQDLSFRKSYPEGQWITHYGSDWPYLFLVENGKVTALKESPEGRSLVVITLDVGDIFWGTGFFKEGVGMPVALVASQDTELRLWPREKLQPYLVQNGQLTWDLARMMVERMMRASRILEELAFQPVAGRLASMLLKQIEAKQGDTLSRDLTLDEMAARIGSTREVVCRQLYHFSDKGAIEIDRTEFRITDRKLLESLAGKGK